MHQPEHGIRPRRRRLREELHEIAQRCAQLPTLDDRSAEEILAYGGGRRREAGLNFMARPLRRALRISVCTFDLHPDGQRFAVLSAPEEGAEEKLDHVVLIQNFFEELRRVEPPAKR